MCANIDRGPRPNVNYLILLNCDFDSRNTQTVSVRLMNSAIVARHIDIRRDSERRERDLSLQFHSNVK